MRRALLLAATALVLLAAPASAENPVLDAEGDADLAAALSETTDVQDVCYGYELLVDDQDAFAFSGTFTTSSLGVGVFATPEDPRCADGVVVLIASVTYTSSFSEAEDVASWRLLSDLPELTIDDVERLGFDAGDLLDDGTSETTLLNAVQALPRLATEQAGKPPVLLEPNTAALPADARPTGTPGSDVLRESGPLLGFCVLLILAGVVLLVMSRRTPSSPTAPYDRPPYDRPTYDPL